jgi:hypothetical protein
LTAIGSQPELLSQQKVAPSKTQPIRHHTTPTPKIGNSSSTPLGMDVLNHVSSQASVRKHLSLFAKAHGTTTELSKKPPLPVPPNTNTHAPYDPASSLSQNPELVCHLQKLRDPSLKPALLPPCRALSSPRHPHTVNTCLSSQVRRTR